MNCVILNAIRNVQARRNMAYRFCSSTNGSDATVNKDTSIPELPPEPTTCCMSGCQNCVWIQYAADLTKMLDDGGEKAREIVLEKISDPSLKMFLKMELQNIQPTKTEDPT
ncbi:oxidoreductase-like domain-containing protein 1 [Anopheles maculipalpis]|uniref:oxidoreductase-like domain-containing protein 1 n=1 Tax=Anopheles maculipalpis TaxID=1496333 RepID=UPI002158B5B0|nr:oxidoreductase-like domain-containing protein 1 [Anopheles maculipalpis]